MVCRTTLLEETSMLTIVRKLDTYNIRWRRCRATPDLGTV